MGGVRTVALLQYKKWQRCINRCCRGEEGNDKNKLNVSRAQWCPHRRWPRHCLPPHPLSSDVGSVVSSPVSLVLNAVIPSLSEMELSIDFKMPTINYNKWISYIHFELKKALNISIIEGNNNDNILGLGCSISDPSATSAINYTRDSMEIRFPFSRSPRPDGEHNLFKWVCFVQNIQ